MSGLNIRIFTTFICASFLGRGFRRGFAFRSTKGCFIFPGLPHELLNVADIEVGQNIPAGRCRWLAGHCQVGCGGLVIRVGLTVHSGVDISLDVRTVGCFRRVVCR